MKIRLFINALSLCIIFTCNAALSQTVPVPTPSPWPSRYLGRILSDIGDEWDNAGESISVSIFESLTDFTLFKASFLGDEGESSIGLRRKVYNNFDLLESYTVIDIFEAPSSLPIPLSNNETGLSNGTFALSLNLTSEMSAVHIRQVLPKDFKELPTPENINEKIKKALKKEHSTEKAFGNTLTQARYTKIFNLFTQPFGLPLTHTNILKMPAGDIRSWSLDGSIQMGATVGWSALDVIGLNQTNVGVGLGLYLSGKFRVSVLKEKQNHALLKVSRIRNHGVNLNLGSANIDHEIFEGFVVLGKNVLRIKESVIPFSLTLNKNISKQFDVGYRFDLGNEQAMKAYLKASIGRLKLAEELSKNIGSGVEKVFTREQREISRSRNYEMKLSLIYRRGHSTTRKFAEAKISIAGKKHKLFTATNINFKGRELVFGISESFKYRFITTIDENEFNNNKNGIALKIEGEIKDHHTRPKELRKYFSEVEMATGQEKLFKRPPLYLPNSNCEEFVNCRFKKIRDFKKTTFFYRIGYNRKQLEKFANFPANRMWPLIEKAFNVKKGSWATPAKRVYYRLRNSYLSAINLPLALLDLNIKNGGKLVTARGFFKSWRGLKEIKDAKLLSRAMGKMFSTVNFNKEIIRLIREALKGEKIHYYITAEAEELFGQLTKTGHYFPEIDIISADANRRIDFDSFGPRPSIDNKAVIEEFDFKFINKKQASITFRINEDPTHLYIRLDRTQRWRKHKNILKTVLEATKFKIKKGLNKFIINKDAVEGLEGLLSRKIFNVLNKYISLTLAYSRSENTWGTTSTQRERVPTQD